MQDMFCYTSEGCVPSRNTGGGSGGGGGDDYAAAADDDNNNNNNLFQFEFLRLCFH
jgi:hypothetical protein